MGEADWVQHVWEFPLWGQRSWCLLGGGPDTPGVCIWSATLDCLFGVLGVSFFLIRRIQDVDISCHISLVDIAAKSSILSDPECLIHFGCIGQNLEPCLLVLIRSAFPFTTFAL